MLTKMGKATFKCKDCGETFETIYTEGGVKAGINLPHCPKCGSGNTRKATIIECSSNKELMTYMDEIEGKRTFTMLAMCHILKGGKLLNIFLFMCILTMISACDSKREKEWIMTENGFLFWGVKSSDDAVYFWDGDSIFNLAHGKGKLKVVEDNGEYTNTQNIKLNFGSIRKQDWKHTVNGLFLGQMKENKPEGFGVLKTDSIISIGEFDEGVLSEGVVTILHNDIIHYHGDYSNSQYHGYGILYDKKGRIQYIGGFKEGLYHGYGKLFNDSCLVYVGNWKKGLYHGEGILYQKGVAIKGDWSKGVIQESFVNRTLEQVADQWNSLLGRDISTKKQNMGIVTMTNAESFVMDSLTSFISNTVREKLKENVEDRFGVANLPRMLWQKCFTNNVNRMEYSQEAFLQNLTSEEIEGMVNEKIRYYNENAYDVTLKTVSFTEIEKHEIVTETVFKLIQARETMEYTDLLLGIIIDAIIAAIIGFVGGFIIIRNGIIGSVFGLVIGIIFGICTTGKAETKLEEEISQQVIENYMNYINRQDIINKILY